MVIPLTYIEPGVQAEVVWIASSPSMAGRLDDLGFSPGETVSCVLKKPGKGMRAYLVRGGRHRPALRKRQGNLRAARGRLTF